MVGRKRFTCFAQGDNTLPILMVNTHHHTLGPIQSYPSQFLTLHYEVYPMSTTNTLVSTNQTNKLEVLPRPAWLDEQLYPFQSHFVEVEGNRIHYIDEGSGPIVLFVHPGFGWSFTNRELIKGLRDRYRCVALD